MRPGWSVGGAAIAAVAGAMLGTGALALPPAAAVVPGAVSIEVQPGGDAQRAIDQAHAGDTVSLGAGTYRGPLRIDTSITLTSSQATVRAPARGAAIIVTAENVTIESVTAACGSTSGGTRGIEVEASHVSIIDSSAVHCGRGVFVNGAGAVYLQGDDFLSDSAPNGPTAGLWASFAEGLTMFDNTFEADTYGMVVQNTANAGLDSNTFTQVGTAVELQGATDSVLSGTLVVGATGPAVTVSGGHGVEISRFGIGGGAQGDGPAIELTADAGPTSIADVSDSDLANFATGILVTTGSLTSQLDVLGTDFSGVKGAAIVVERDAGGVVDATISDFFGGCGPRAPDHGYDGGGVVISDPQRVITYRVPNCRTPTPATSTPAPTGTPGASTPKSSSTPAVGGGRGNDSTPTGEDGFRLPEAIGSALVTLGVTLLLVACAVWVLVAIRRNRRAH